LLIVTVAAPLAGDPAPPSHAGAAGHGVFSGDEHAVNGPLPGTTPIPGPFKMPLRNPGSDLLAEALGLLQEADRMHRQFFTLSLGRSGPSWEPPVDMTERAGVVLIRVALPGVTADSLEVVSDGRQLVVRGIRRLDAARGETIHRLEIPYGRFERRIELPAGRFEVGRRELADGCLLLTLNRIS
jgi:HSP20 family molecular chaperone IbpA